MDLKYMDICLEFIKADSKMLVSFGISRLVVYTFRFHCVYSYGVFTPSG